MGKVNVNHQGMRFYGASCEGVARYTPTEEGELYFDTPFYKNTDNLYFDTLLFI